MNVPGSLDDYLSALLDDATPDARPPAAAAGPPALMTGAATAALAPAAPLPPAPLPPAPSPPAPAAITTPSAELPRAAPHTASQAACVALLQKLAQRDEPGEPRPRRRASERTTRWLRMRCDEQQYALELLKIQEVVLPGALLPLRGAPPHMLGVMNLRGQIVPVVDLGLYLQRGAIIADACTRIVVVEENGEVLGLRVSAVEDVANLSEQQIEAPGTTGVCRITSQLFRGVARAGGRTLILLDATSLLE